MVHLDKCRQFQDFESVSTNAIYINLIVMCCNSHCQLLSCQYSKKISVPCKNVNKVNVPVGSE